MTTEDGYEPWEDELWDELRGTDYDYSGAVQTDVERYEQLFGVGWREFLRRWRAGEIADTYESMDFAAMAVALEALGLDEGGER